LIGDNLLECRLQDRFRTWPGGGRLTRIEQRRIWMNKAGKKRAVEITLGVHATGTAVMPLGESL